MEWRKSHLLQDPLLVSSTMLRIKYRLCFIFVAAAGDIHYKAIVSLDYIDIGV